MEAIWTVNIFSELFGIFRQRGLVETYKQEDRLTGFFISAIVLVIFGGALYGFAMGIGLGIETAIKDSIKIALIAILGLLLAIPIFWLAYRLLGHQQRLAQVAAVPLTLVAAVLPRPSFLCSASWPDIVPMRSTSMWSSLIWPCWWDFIWPVH